MLMPKFGHIHNGSVLDVHENASLEEYKARFSNEVIGWWSSHTFVQLPDTDSEGDPIKHGAVSNGDGTYTNPENVPIPEPEPEA